MTIFKCPFCGNSLCEIRGDHLGKCFVECSGCHSRGPSFFNEEESVYAWNDVRQSVENEYEHKDKRDLINYIADEIANAASKIKGAIK